MRYSQTGTISSRSKTPSNRSLIEIPRKVRVEVSSPTPTKIAYRPSEKSMSPVRTPSRPVLSIDPQKEFTDKLKEERDLKLKLKTLFQENDALLKMQEKIEKELLQKRQKYEEEKSQIIDLFTEFVIQKNVFIDLPNAQSARTLNRSFAETNDSKLLSRDRSQPRISQSNSMVNTLKNDYDCNQSSGGESKMSEDAKYLMQYLLKDLEKSQVSSNIKALFLSGQIGL